MISLVETVDRKFRRFTLHDAPYATSQEHAKQFEISATPDRA